MNRNSFRVGFDEDGDASVSVNNDVVILTGTVYGKHSIELCPRQRELVRRNWTTCRVLIAELIEIEGLLAAPTKFPSRSI